MHVALDALFEIGPLRGREGGVDIDAVREASPRRCSTASRATARSSQYIPLERHPVWVDDDRFNLDYHLRHTRAARARQRSRS